MASTQRTTTGQRLAGEQFTGQGELVAMKTLSSHKAPRCDKDQFCDKMTVSTSTVFEISLLNFVVLTRKKERKKTKNGTFATAHFCV